MKKLLITALIIAFVLVFNCDGVGEQFLCPMPALDSGSTLIVGKQEPIKCLYYDERAFLRSIPSEKNRKPSGSTVKGGIVPHHLVAAPMIGRLFSELNTNPERIIILGPNHKRVGTESLHTGAFTWKTPLGELQADTKITEEIINRLDAGVIPSLLEQEHSISALVPYIKYFFPEAQIVPILVHGNMNDARCKELVTFLSEKSQSSETLILASIDFSHGLKPVEALEHNEISIKAIENRDYDLIFTMDNTYLDAPPVLVSFLMAMDKLGTKEGTLLENSEASRFLGRHVLDTTSYLTYVFR